MAQRVEAEKGESRAYQIGVIGCGYLGRSLYDRLRGRRVKVVAIHDSDADKLSSIDPADAIEHPKVFIDRAAELDLVVEVAHPSVTETMGEPIIGRTNYMPCSVAALADQALMGRLLAKSEAAGTRLYIPHGAAVGIDNLIERDELTTQVGLEQRLLFASRPAQSMQLTCSNHG